MGESPDGRVEIRSRAVQNWIGIALAAREEVSRLKHGHRERGFETVAVRFGVAAQTVRRALAALDFCDDDGAVFDVDLRSVPLAAVESLRRWHQYDVAGARDAANRLVAGATIAWVTEAERRSRLERGFRLAATREPQSDFGETVCEYIIAVYPEYTKIHLRDNKIKKQYGKYLPYSDIYLSRGGVLKGAVQLVDRVAGSIERKMTQKLMIAVAFTLLVERSFIACEHDDEQRFCFDWLNNNKINDRVGILSVFK